MALELVPGKTYVTNPSHITATDVGNQTIAVLKDKYLRVEIGVIETTLGTYHTLDLDNVKHAHSIRVSEFLKTVPMSLLTPGLPDPQYVRSKYLPIFRAFKYVKLCGKDMHPSQPVEPSEAVDLFLRDPVYKDIILENCLFTVNGFFVMAAPYLDGIRLYGAGSIIHRSGDMSCGVLVMPASVKCRPFTDDEIQFDNNGGLYVKAKDTGRTLACVVGGGIWFANDSDSRLRLFGRDLYSFSFTPRYVKNHILNYGDELGLNVNFDVTNFLALEDEALKRKILALQTSFIIEVDAPQLLVDHDGVGKHWWGELGVPNSSPAHYDGLVTNQNNRVIDYWGVFSDATTILYHTFDDVLANTPAYSSSVRNEDPKELITDKKRLRPEPEYRAHISKWYTVRVS
ncbi:MAG: hypothetical protein ACRDDY_05420 [Clostridium sp.]|uniref:hypothetical protein n=1 Tax=Clostridium sp. TaxID=1506 RepID=UPI003EE48EA7